MYFLVRWLCIAIVRSFFKEVAVLHPERIPLYGPAIFVGNHNNQFMDASMLVANIPRQLRFLVAMKSMKRRVIGLLSRLAGGIPVVRQDDLAAKGEGLVRVSHHFTSASHVCPPPPHHYHIHPRRHAENTDNTSNSSRCSSVSPSPAGTAGAERRPGKGDEEEKEEDEERRRRGAGAGGGKGEQADFAALQVAVTEVEAARRRGTNEGAAAEEGAAAGAGAGTQEQQRREGSGQQANSLSAAKGRAAGPEAAEEEEKGISSWWRAVRSPAQRARCISDAAAANVAAAADKIAEFEGDAAVAGADSAPATAGREGRGAAAAASREKPEDRNQGELLVAASGSTQPAIAAAQSRPPLLSILGDKTRFLRDCSAGCKLLIEKQHYSIVKVLSDTHLLATAVETEAPHSMLKRSRSERAVAPAGGEGGEDVAAAGLEAARSRRDGAAALGARDNPRSSSERRRRRRAAEATSVARGRSSSGDREHHVRRSLRRGGRSSSKSRSKSARPASASNASMHAAAAGQGKGLVSAIKPGAAGTAARGPAAGGAAPAAGAGEEERERGGDGTTAASLLRAQGEAAKDTDVWRDASPATILQSVSSDDATPAACRRFAVRDDASAAGTGKREWVYSEELSSRDSAGGGFSPVSSGKQTSSGEHTHNDTSDNASRSSSDSGSSSSSDSRAGTSAEERVNREDDAGESAAVQARKEQEENNKNEKQEMEEQLAEGGGLRRRRGGKDATPDAAEPTAAAISRNHSLQLPSTVTGEGAAAATSRMFLSPSSSQHTLPRQYGDRHHYRDRLAATYKPYKIIPHVDQRKVYEDVSRSLIEGDCIGIFPEGGSHDRTTLLPLKAGVAIMALQGLAAGAEDVMIVPVGLTYHNPHKTQSRATVCIGDPIPISRELAVEYERDRRAATTQILSDVEKGMRSCIITAQDHETILLIKLSCSLYPPERLRLSPGKYFNLNQLLSKLFWRCSEEPELLKLRQGLVQYQGSLARAGIPDHDVWMLKQSTAGASLYFAEKLIALAYSIAFGVPLLPLWGPLRVLARILAEAHRAKALAASSVKVKGTDVVASYKVIVLLVCVPLFNILYGALVGFFFLDSWKETLVTILLCVCLLPVSYYVSMRRAERILPLMRQIRTLIMVLVGKVNVWRENERELVTQRTEMQLCVRDTLFHVGPRTSPTFIDELYAIVPKAVLDADTKRLVRKKEDFAPLQMKYLLNNADEIL